MGTVTVVVVPVDVVDVEAEVVVVVVVDVAVTVVSVCVVVDDTVVVVSDVVVDVAVVEVAVAVVVVCVALVVVVPVVLVAVVVVLCSHKTPPNPVPHSHTTALAARVSTGVSSPDPRRKSSVAPEPLASLPSLSSVNGAASKGAEQLPPFWHGFGVQRSVVVVAVAVTVVCVVCVCVNEVTVGVVVDVADGVVDAAVVVVAATVLGVVQALHIAGHVLETDGPKIAFVHKDCENRRHSSASNSSPHAPSVRVVLVVLVVVVAVSVATVTVDRVVASAGVAGDNNAVVVVAIDSEVVARPRQSSDST